MEDSIVSGLRELPDVYDQWFYDSPCSIPSTIVVKLYAHKQHRMSTFHENLTFIEVPLARVRDAEVSLSSAPYSSSDLRRGGVLPAIMTSLALPDRRVFNVDL